MRGPLEWLWLRRREGRDFDGEGREWLRRLCGPPPRQEGRRRRLPQIRWGKLLAFAAISAGFVALYNPTVPLVSGPRVIPSSAAAGRIVGYPRIIDGDTLDINGTRIRLHGIDAPELKQQCRRERNSISALYPCGRDAKVALERIIGSGEVACEARDQDRYGRTIAVCYAQGVDIGREMVRQGWAVAYARYSTAYVADERAARAANWALWSGQFEAPEEWRQRHKNNYDQHSGRGS